MFIGNPRLETDEQEIARLKQAPIGSSAHTLSTLPIVNPNPDTGTLVQLPRETSNGHAIIGALLEFRSRSTQENNERILRNKAGVFRIFHSEHPDCPQGGYDIIVNEEMLRRSDIVSISHLVIHDNGAPRDTENTHVH